MGNRTEIKHPVTGDDLWIFERSGTPEDISAFSRTVEGKKANMAFAFLQEDAVETSIETEFSVDWMEDDDIESAVRRLCKEIPIVFVGYNQCTNAVVIGLSGQKIKDSLFLKPVGINWEPSETEQVWKNTGAKIRKIAMFSAMETLADCKAGREYKPLTESKDAISKMYADSFYALWTSSNSD